MIEKEILCQQIADMHGIIKELAGMVEVSCWQMEKQLKAIEWSFAIVKQERGGDPDQGWGGLLHGGKVILDLIRKRFKETMSEKP